MEAIKNFKDLKVWQEGHGLVIVVYTLTKSFPKDEMFGLTSQIRRAVVSVTANIAEGFGRRTLKEKLQFYFQSQGSLTELEDELLIAKDVKYINDNAYTEVQELIELVHRLLAGLIRKTKSLVNNV